MLCRGGNDHGAVGIVAVLSSLYPIVTLVLAWLVLGERLGATQRVGGFVALAGAALVAAGYAPLAGQLRELRRRGPQP